MFSKALRAGPGRRRRIFCRQLVRSSAFLLNRLRGGRFEPLRAGFSVGVGLFIGAQPLYGLHLPLCLAICVPLRLDALLAYAAANISNPLLAPLIVLSEIQLGSLVVYGRVLPIHMSQLKGSNIGHLAVQLGLGAVLLGVVLSIAGGLLAANIAKWAQRRRRNKTSLDARVLRQAILRTCQRYNSVPTADRHYVANKLRFDPVTTAICDATAHLGDVVDVGCGRGQLGLLLYELGRIRTLTGFDWDECKIDVARIAATNDALYFVQDAQSAVIPRADTILIVDVLHYLPLTGQEELLQRAAVSLRTGGTLVVREVDAKRTLGSVITQWFERLSIYSNFNRGSAPSFRSRQQQCEALCRHGLAVTEVVTMPGFVLDNVLFLAKRTS